MPNTTIYNLEVTFNDQIYNPTIRVADCGTWDIQGHESMHGAMGRDTYTDWLCAFWAARRIEEATYTCPHCGTDCAAACNNYGQGWELQ